MSGIIRVLVVDDSALMRKRISNILNSDDKIEVVGTARDGDQAFKLVEQLKPDVVTLDIELPKMDGITCLGYIMSECPTPVIIITGYVEYKGEHTLKALEFGAVDFIIKPSGVISLDIENIAQEIISKVKLAATVDVSRMKLKLLPEKKAPEPALPKVEIKKVVVIAASTGGPKALSEILSKLPKDIQAPILVVQHMPAGFTKALAGRLDTESKIRVKEAEEGDEILAGTAYIAPGDYHMAVIKNEKGNGVIKLLKTHSEQGVRPCANVTMRSAAEVYGNRNIGVVLTGMGSDGTEGLKAIKLYGGRTIAEDPKTAVIFGMPLSAIKAEVVDKTVQLDFMAAEIVRSVQA
ncbi:MAG: chemotaxis response regulator protein-glutamate methylesterase [Armatimonadota bacterium]